MRLANASLLVVLGRANSAAIDAPCVREELGSRTPDDVDLVLRQPHNGEGAGPRGPFPAGAHRAVCRWRGVMHRRAHRPRVLRAGAALATMALAAALAPAPGRAPPAPPTVPGARACPIFPASNVWNRPVSS